MPGGLPDDGFPWIGVLRVCYPQARDDTGTRPAVVRTGARAGRPVSHRNASTWH
jgi:hypothetical protein